MFREVAQENYVCVPLILLLKGRISTECSQECPLNYLDDICRKVYSKTPYLLTLFHADCILYLPSGTLNICRPILTISTGINTENFRT